MEEKHIYSSSFRFRFFNLLNSYENSFKKFLAEFSKPKPKKPLSNFPITAQPKKAPSIPKVKPQTAKFIQKEKVVVKTPRKYPKKLILILIYALFIAIVFLMAFGIFMSV